MGRHLSLSKFILIIVAVALVAGSIITTGAQPAGAQVASLALRVGIVPDPDPSGPLFEGPFTRRQWATFIDGRTGAPKVIVVEVSDPAPVGGATSDIDTIRVRVISDTDEAGISNLVLRETSNTSNTYRGTFVLNSRTTSASTHPGIADPTNPSRPTLEVDEGDDVVVSYRNRVARLVVEVEPPSIRNFLPDHDSFLTSRVITATAQVVDEESGIDENDVFFMVSDEQLKDIDIFDRRTGDPDPLDEIVENEGLFLLSPDSSRVIRNASGMDIGFDITGLIAVNTSGGLGEVYVTVAALDKAGNLTVFDVDSDDDVVLAKFTVDSEPPELFQARTGVEYDSRAKQLRGNKFNKLQVIFRDRTDLDPRSIQASDFQVTGHQVTRVDWFDANPLVRDYDGSGLSSNDSRAVVRRMVFLTLTPDLKPDERPEVFVVPDGVRDQAGNTLRSAKITARDAIGPQLSLRSITPTLAGSNTRVEMEIASEEALASGRRPIVTVTNVADRTNTLAASVVSSGTNRWRVTISPPTRTGIYNIFVAATDRDGNFIGLGLESLDLLPVGNPDGIIDNFFLDPDDDEINEDAIFFEADRDLPNPRVTPRSSGEIAQRDTMFLTVDFGEVAPGQTAHEGNEYRGDTHDEVTLTTATLDGEDVLARASSSDRKKWIISASNLGLGTHTLVVNGRDEAGNELERDLEIRFRVVSGERFELPLNPGWNLVSFPGAPANPAIDSVFPPTRAIKTVYGFDPTVPGGWQVAVRDRRADGSYSPFIGDLKTIRAERGYWVQTDTSEDIQIDLLRVGVGSSGAAPPEMPTQIQIFEGWNLVPVIDLTRQLDAGDVIDSDVYFAGLEDKVVRIYTYDEAIGQWRLIVRDGRIETGTQQQLTQSGAAGACATCPLAPNEAVVVGKAYWLFAIEEGVLVP